MKTLVTGGCGFIGSHLVDQLVRDNHQVVVLDDLSTGSRKNIRNNGVKIIEGDILDPAMRKKALRGVDAVFHMAALVSVRESVVDPQQCFTSNDMGTFAMLSDCRDRAIKRFIFSSSSAVYGNSPMYLFKNESQPHRLESPYATSKFVGELYMEQFAKQYGMETISLRYFNVYGTRQRPDSPYSGVIAKFIHCKKSGEKPTIYGDGKQTRDFVHVSDVVRANIMALHTDQYFGQAFNVGTGEKQNLLDILKALQIKECKYDEPRQGDVIDSCADITKIQECLNFYPSVKFKNGLKKNLPKGH